LSRKRRHIWNPFMAAAAYRRTFLRTRGRRRMPRLDQRGSPSLRVAPIAIACTALHIRKIGVRDRNRGTAASVPGLRDRPEVRRVPREAPAITQSGLHSPSDTVMVNPLYGVSLGSSGSGGVLAGNFRKRVACSNA